MFRHDFGGFGLLEIVFGDSSGLGAAALARRSRWSDFAFAGRHGPRCWASQPLLLEWLGAAAQGVRAATLGQV